MLISEGREAGALSWLVSRTNKVRNAFNRKHCPSCDILVFGMNIGRGTGYPVWVLSIAFLRHNTTRHDTTQHDTTRPGICVLFHTRPQTWCCCKCFCEHSHKFSSFVRAEQVAVATDGVLRCDVVRSGGNVPTFQTFIVQERLGNLVQLYVSATVPRKSALT
jgi:hypothetical protein